MKRSIISVCAVLAAVLMAGCGDESKKSVEYKTVTLDETVVKPINDYFDGYNNDKPESAVMSFTPQICIDKMKEDNSYDELVQTARGDIKNTYEMWQSNYGENCSVQIVGNVIGTPMSKNQLICSANYLDMYYYDLDLDFTIEEGYAVDFKFSVTGDTDKLEGDQKACLVKPENDDWKLILTDIETINLYNGADVNLGGNDDESSEQQETT